jgi:hypothetical protein
VVVSGSEAVFAEVRSGWQPGDGLVVVGWDWAQIAAEFEARRSGLETWKRIETSGEGEPTEATVRASLREIDAFRGKRRTWFYIDWIAPCEEEAIVGYLSAIGNRLHAISSDLGPNASDQPSVYLYDFSDPSRLPRASAMTYPIECGQGEAETPPGQPSPPAAAGRPD